MSFVLIQERKALQATNTHMHTHTNTLFNNADSLIKITSLAFRQLSAASQPVGNCAGSSADRRKFFTDLDVKCKCQTTMQNGIMGNIAQLFKSLY